MAHDDFTKFNSYETLGIPSTATQQEIKLARRQATLRAHPDVGGSHDEQVRINLAYEILSDPVRRQAHDAFWGRSPNGNSDRKRAPRPSASQRTRETRSHAEPKRSPPGRGDSLVRLTRRFQEQVQAAKTKVWDDLAVRIQQNERAFAHEFSSYRLNTLYMFAAAIALGLAAVVFPALWIGEFFLGMSLLSRIGGTSIAGRRFSLFASIAADIRPHAKDVANQSCEADSSLFDRHDSALTELIEFLRRPSRQADSAEQIGRRYATALFLAGYMPVLHNRGSRLLVMSAGDEVAIVLMRHGGRSPANISQVEKLVQLMDAYHSRQGYLYSPAGLSENAADLAEKHGVNCHAIDALNTWVQQILISDYGGPAGDILGAFEKFCEFASTVVPAPRSGGPHHRNARRGRRWRY